MTFNVSHNQITQLILLAVAPYIVVCVERCCVMDGLVMGHISAGGRH